MTSITAHIQAAHLRFVRTPTGIDIGSAHRRAPRADVAPCVAGPYRSRHTLGDRAVGFMCGVGAAAVAAVLAAEWLA